MIYNNLNRFIIEKHCTRAIMLEIFQLREYVILYNIIMSCDISYIYYVLYYIHTLCS